MRAYMYSVALILACVATTVLTETNAENADSQATIRALLNDLNAAKSTNERQHEALEAAKVTIEEQGAKLEAHGQGIKALSTATRHLMVQDIEGTRVCVSATKGGKCVKAAAAAASQAESLVASLGEGTGGATGVTVGETSAGLKQICIVATSSKVATIKKQAESVLKQGDKKAATTKTVRKGASDPGAVARCESVHDGYTAGKKKCPIGKYARMAWKTSSCPDGIGWQGVYFDQHRLGGVCLPWNGNAAAAGTLTCEQHTCVNAKTGLSSATYPRAKSGTKQYILNCKKPGITPYKGVCDKTDNKAFCDKSGAPTVCLKLQALHVNKMSRSAGVLILKRSSCPRGKCSTFKSGLCIDVRRNVWSSSLNKKNLFAKGGMVKQAKRFGQWAKWLLKKYKNKLPKKHRCSDHRRWNKDATLSRFAILNF